jgi:ArsR family transcriptional regulator
VRLDPVRVFRALGNETRLQITTALSERESCVSDLRERVGASWSTVSQHLSVLKNAGVVDCTKQGNQVLYRLALPCVATFVHCLEAVANGAGEEARTCCN